MEIFYKSSMNEITRLEYLKPIKTVFDLVPSDYALTEKIKYFIMFKNLIFNFNLNSS